jgi:hypothetical protein
MNEQAPLSPEQAADRSGDLYEQYKDLAESYTNFDRIASKSAEQVARDETILNNTDDKEVLESRQRALKSNQLDLEMMAAMAYALKHTLEVNQREATSLVRQDGDALHEAALAAAKLHDIDIIEPANSSLDDQFSLSR